MRAEIAQIDKPPEIHPSTAKPKYSPDQMELSYA
jgi:hypothetical protein